MVLALAADVDGARREALAAGGRWLAWGGSSPPAMAAGGRLRGSWELPLASLVGAGVWFLTRTWRSPPAWAARCCMRWPGDAWWRRWWRRAAADFDWTVTSAAGLWRPAAAGVGVGVTLCAGVGGEWPIALVVIAAGVDAGRLLALTRGSRLPPALAAGGCSLWRMDDARRWRFRLGAAGVRGGMMLGAGVCGRRLLAVADVWRSPRALAAGDCWRWRGGVGAHCPLCCRGAAIAGGDGCVWHRCRRRGAAREGVPFAAGDAIERPLMLLAVCCCLEGGRSPPVAVALGCCWR